MQERAFYDRHRNDHIETNDDDFYDHVRAGDSGVNDPKSKFNRRKQGDPGVNIDQLMRFFNPKLARKMDDSAEVSQLPAISLICTGILLGLPNIVQRPLR